MSRLFADYQVARFNELYYQKRASSVRKRATFFKIVSALAASAALTGLLSGSFFGTLALQILTAAAAICSAIGPYLGWDNKVSQLERAALGHAIATDRIRKLLKDLKLTELTESHEARETEITAFRDSLTALDEAPNDAVRTDCWKAVEKELPAEQAWSII
jgi:hypothetical protein